MLRSGLQDQGCPLEATGKQMGSTTGSRSMQKSIHCVLYILIFSGEKSILVYSGDSQSPLKKEKSLMPQLGSETYDPSSSLPVPPILLHSIDQEEGEGEAD